MGASLLAAGFFLYLVQTTLRSPPYRSLAHILVSYLKSTASVFLSAVAALVAPILVALFLMSSSRHMAWFKREWYGAVLFGPTALIGMYGVQYLVGYRLPGPRHVDMEHGTLVSLMLAFALTTFLTTQTGVASSYIFWIYCMILLLATGANELLRGGNKKAARHQVHDLTYAVCAIPMALLYVDYAYAMIDIFVPLTGRMGVDTPVDVIIAVVFGMITYMTFLPSLAHVHRFGKRVLSKIFVYLLVLQIAVLGTVLVGGGQYGGWWFPYDEYHPKRM